MPDNELNRIETPLHKPYSAPKSTACAVSRSEVRRWLQDSGDSGRKDFLLIDLRRNDHEGGTIRGSINLPAQSLYPTIPTLFTVFSAANIKKVVWYCGSSQHRGPQAAGWFVDYLEEKGDEGKGMESLVLEGGFNGWVSAGEEKQQLRENNLA